MLRQDYRLENRPHRRVKPLAMQRHAPSQAFRASIDWFEHRTLSTFTSLAEFHKTLGERGHELAVQYGMENLESVASYVHSRNLRLSRFWPVAQEEVVNGLTQWVEQHGDFDVCYFYENLLNNRMIWRPLPEKHPSLHPYQFTLELCRHALNRAQLGVEFGDWSLKFTAMRSRRGGNHVGRGEVRQILHHLIKAYQAEFDKEKYLVGLLPEKIGYHDADRLAHLLMPKDDGYELSGAPGRFTFLPLETREWLHLSERQKPKFEFTVGYLPIDLDLQRRFEDFDKLGHGYEARFEKHQMGKLERPPFSDPGMFPGALAYSRLCIFQENGSLVGMIQEVQSDVSQHAPKYVPNSLCLDLVPFLIDLLKQMGCKTCLYPTMGNIEEQSAIDDLNPDQLARWRQSLERIYGNPPPLFDLKPRLFRKKMYYERTL